MYFKHILFKDSQTFKKNIEINGHSMKIFSLFGFTKTAPNIWSLNNKASILFLKEFKLEFSDLIKRYL
jgi:hypothetical protein